MKPWALDVATGEAAKDLRDVVVGRALFFGALAVGNAVKAHGDLRSGVARWDQVELED